MNYEQVFVNEDLRRHIFSFGTVDHRVLMKNICHDIQVKHTDALLSDLPEIYPYTRDDLVYVADMDMKETLTRFFQMRLCKCCTRHTHNKTQVTLQKSKDFHGVRIVITDKRIWVPECKNLRNCHCECRQETRSLAKLIRYRSHLNSTIV